MAPMRIYTVMIVAIQQMGLYITQQRFALDVRRPLSVHKMRRFVLKRMRYAMELMTVGMPTLLMKALRDAVKGNGRTITLLKSVHVTLGLNGRVPMGNVL